MIRGGFFVGRGHFLRVVVVFAGFFIFLHDLHDSLISPGAIVGEDVLSAFFYERVLSVHENLIVKL